jgi:phosphomannomutase
MIQWIANKGSLTGAAVSISGSHLLREPDPENPGAYIEKNGIKLLDIHGRKIPEEWQRYTDGIINSRDLHATILKIAEVEGIFLGDMLAPAPVILPEPNVTLTAAYIKETSDIATRLLESAGLTQQNPMEVIFDLANGAANGPVQQIIGSIPMFAPVYKNDGPGEAINEGCGAEHVDKEHALPKNITAEEVIGKLGVAYDGDADRVMFFTVDSRTGDFVYLDGDWLASIEAAVLQDALRVLGLGDKLKIGGAQTAYSNLEARRYQNKIGVLFDGGDADTGYVRTGDKYVRDNLEERGVRDEIDIGIGFEPAGHGFLIFNPRAKAYIETVNVTTEQQKKAKGLLQGFIDIQNESGGDGIRHSLAAIAAVEYFRQNIADGQITEPADFDKAEVMYKTPSKAHLKVKVKNPNAVRTRGSVGTKLLQPEGLKDAVTAIFAGLSDDNRWVIRPSGTEDVVRVYVEGPDAEVVQAAADRMAEAITSQPETQAAAGGRVVAVITDSNVIGEQFIRDIAERKGVAISQVTIVNVSGDLTPELMTRVANSTGDADVVLVHVRDNSLRKAIADAAGAMGIGMFVLPDAPEEELRDAAAECL